ncbi:MAG: hypothetical protein WCR95_01875 [Eubacteriales bacterium]
MDTNSNSNSNTKTNTSKASDFFTNDYFLYIAAVVLSFAGALLTLPGFGAVSSFMPVLFFAFALAFLKLKWWVKAAFFAGFGYVITSVFTADSLRSGVTAAFCGAAVTLACGAVWFFKGKKNSYFFTAGVIAALMIFANIMVFGNPVDAFNSKTAFDDYFTQNYEKDSLNVSPIYFDFQKRLYRADITPGKSFEKVFTAYIFGGRVYESYGRFAELMTMEEKRLQVTVVLREKFPGDTFYVRQESISRYPDGKIAYPEENASRYEARMCMGIYIPADITPDMFSARVANYLKTLAESGVELGRVNFYGGKTGVYNRVTARRVTLAPQNPSVGRVYESLVAEYMHSRLF